MDALKTSCQLIEHYDPKSAQAVRETEQEADQYEDMLGTYLVKLGRADLNAADSRETAKLLHIIGDFERISDHAVNLVESAEEIRNKGLSFSVHAKQELAVTHRGGGRSDGPGAGRLPPERPCAGCQSGASGAGGGYPEGAAAEPAYSACCKKGNVPLNWALSGRTC